VGVAFSLAFIIGPAIGAFFASTAKSSLAPVTGLNTAPAKFVFNDLENVRRMNDNIERQSIYYYRFAMGVTLLELLLVLLFLPETLNQPVSFDFRHL
jgi:hypothetical protein